MLKQLCFRLLVCGLIAVILAGCGTGQQGTTAVGTRTPAVQATAATSGTVSATPTPSAGPSQPIDALWMSNATTGWARTTTHLILHTTDGGKSWQNVTPPYPAASTVQVPPAFAFLNGTVGWVAVFEKQQPDGTISMAGSVWDFLTMQRGWVVGANGTTLDETSDGGQHWTPITPSANFRHISQLDFVPAREGWAISSPPSPAAPVLLKTMDGVQTWARVS